MIDQDWSRHRSVERLRALIEVVPDKVWISGPDRRPELISRRLIDYSGRRLDELTDVEAVLSLVHPDDLATRLPAMRAATEQGLEHRAELRIRRHDGEYRWHLVRSVPLRDEHGEVEQWFTAATDVHDIRVLEQESQRLAGQLVRTLESVTDGFMLIDEDYRIAYVNPAAGRMAERLGARADALVGHLVADVLPEPGSDVVHESFRRTMDAAETTRFRYRHEPTGLTVDAACYRTASGIAVYLHDVSDLVAIEERLGRAERLESLGHLTGGVAHDFNNLLTVVMGGAGLLREELGADHPSLATVELIESAATRGAELTRRLLAFARRQPLAPQSVDLGELAVDVHALLRRTIGESVVVDLEVEPRLPRALVDPVQLENALINVCLNGRDAMPDGGRLLIEVGATTLGADQAESMEVEPGRFVVVRVTDTGVGIAPEALPRLFEPFFTTKPVGTGTGLGLPMVYGLLKQSGGHVLVRSVPDEGTTVSLYVPTAGDAPAPAPAAAPTEGDARLDGDETVLIVEDDRLVRQFTADQLERHGYTVVTAEDGRAAIDVLGSDRPLDLLITDVVLPGGVSGRDVADVAATRRPGLPILFTSGYSEDAITHDGRLDDGVDLLSKPYPATTLAARVRRALDRRDPDLG